MAEKTDTNTRYSLTKNEQGTHALMVNGVSNVAMVYRPPSGTSVTIPRYRARSVLMFDECDRQAEAEVLALLRRRCRWMTCTEKMDVYPRTGTVTTNIDHRSLAPTTFTRGNQQTGDLPYLGSTNIKLKPFEKKGPTGRRGARLHPSDFIF